MEPEYGHIGDTQAKLRDAIVAQSQRPPGTSIIQPRTFGQIEDSVGELAELNKRLSAALDRLGHCADAAEQADKEVSNRLGPDYSRSLSRLRSEIREMRTNVNALEQHI